MRKCLAILLAALLALCLSTTSLAVTVNETGLPVVDEPYKITIAALRHPNDATDNFNEKWAIQQAAEQTGIEVEWIEFTDSGNERIAVMLAGDLPDVFLGVLSDSQIAQNSSLFVPLTNEMLETYCPNVLKQYEEGVEDWRSFLTYPDGQMYGLMGSIMNSYNDQINGTTWINTQWLDNVGMEMPTTFEELYDVLVAFRDEDADGDGDANNEIPLDFCMEHYASKYWQLAYMFGIPDYYDILDGIVVPTMNTEAFRTFLETMHEMIEEGLINAEGFTQTAEQYNSNLSSLKDGVFFGWAPYTYITDADARKAFETVKPIGAQGIAPRRFANSNIANRNCLVITTACECPEAVLRWWDYLSRDQQSAYEARLGKIDLNFVVDENGNFISKTPTAEEAIAAGYEELASIIGTSTWTASMGLTLCAPLMYYGLPNPDPNANASIRRASVEPWEPYFCEQNMSKAIVPTENQEAFDFGTDGLLDYIDAFVASSFINGVTDESWAAYNDGLNAHGYDMYIEWYQSYLDGDFVK